MKGIPIRWDNICLKLIPDTKAVLCGRARGHEGFCARGYR